MFEKERKEARDNLIGLGFLPEAAIAELVDIPVTYRYSLEAYWEDVDRKQPQWDSYISHLEAALEARPQRNWYHLIKHTRAKPLENGCWRGVERSEYDGERGFSPGFDIDLDFDFEAWALRAMIDAAKKARREVPRGNKNQLRHDTLAKRDVIRQIVPICRRYGITPVASPESQFYLVAQAVSGGISPDTIRAAIEP